MASQFQRWLSGFSTYRSYNLGVLCNDEEIKEVYAEARGRGKLPFNRSKVMFLGDARVGKTSLRRALTGETFRENEASTEGIETRMYESTEVDSAWHMSADNSHDDFEFASAWYTALKSKSEKRKLGKRPIGNQYNRSSLKATAGKYIIDAFYIFRIYLSVQLLCIIPHCDIFSYGFAPFEWFLFLAMTIAGLDFLTEAYRFGTGVALVLFIEHYIRCYLTVDAVILFCKTPFSNVTFINYFTFMILFLCIGFVLGALCGCGFRTGLAFGLCLLLPPEWAIQKDPILVFDFTKGVSTFLAMAPITLGHMIGLILVRSWTLTMGRLPSKLTTDLTFLMLSLLAMSVLLSIAIPEPNVALSLLGSILLFFGKTTGEFIGREIDAKLNFNYFTYKGIGTLIGLVVGYFMGWTFCLTSIVSPTFLVFLISVLTHPIIEMYGFWKVKSQTLPVIDVRNAFRAQKRGFTHLPTRLSLWDFAGNELYYSTHHVFLASHAIYLLVFSLEQATKNKYKQLNRILFWLQSISIHAKDKDAVIFLVGTHRDSVGLSDQEDIDQYLFENLYVNFCDRLKVNPKRRLVFMVENSVANDSERSRIKYLISSIVNEAEYMTREYPIKYLNFYKLILSKRNKDNNRHFSQSISSYTDVAQYTCRECGITSDDGFRDLLSFFHRAGDIIYRTDDPILEQYVVFDPQLLVDVMKVLVNIPPHYKRSQKVAPYWLKLEQHGVLHSSLIEHIVKPFNVPTNVIISLLTAYDLICPILQKTTRTVDELFSVPCLMPRYSSMINEAPGTTMNDWWISSEDEETYYFDFGYLLPDAVFSRLLARCLNEDQVRDQARMREVFYDVGKFIVDSKILVKLELLHFLPQQNLIKVTVQRPIGSDSRKCIAWLIDHVEAIRRRDFKYLEYTFGVLCPSLHHCNPGLQGTLHIVRLASQVDCHLREAGPLTFLCEGRSHVLEVFKSRNASITGMHGSSVAVMHPDGNIIDLPPTLHKQICNILNVESIVAGDWRDLAAEIGCLMEDTRVFSNCKNPCGEVLHYWSTKCPVTIKELIDVLQRPSLSRVDLVLLLQNHIVYS
ncbi:uncharacterized protein [Ptychodera flava]|uniref:uncharacterized protein isoform X1 n=1 Tax=Ptychodera flava TaxID=63121 RepID=UPI00396A1CF5